MKRRDFIKNISVASVASALPFPLLASDQGAYAAVNTKKLFNEALGDNPNLIGYANVEKDFSLQNLTIEGQVPKDIKGMFFRNGPAKHERDAQRYLHLFEGDGMVQQFNIENGQISHRGKFVNTPKYLQEEQAQKFLFSGPDTKLKTTLPVSSADHVNTANTNIIAVNDELWALWEGGSATAIDKQSLSFKKHVNLGDQTKWGNSLKGLPFSAHPKVEANGDIWNFGLNRTGHLVLYHLSANGALKNVKLIQTQYKAGMLHDFLITQRHILIILPSLVRNPSRSGLFSGIKFEKTAPMDVLVIDKNTLEVSKQYQLPSGFVFHFGNAWEDKQGDIHFDASLYNDVTVLHELSDVMAGKQASTPSHAYTTLFSLYKNGSASSQKFEEISEFPRVCEHLTGLENRYLFHLSSQPDSLWSDSVVARDLKNENRMIYHYGEDFLVEEHIPVCPTKEEGKGYLIGSALHVPSKRTCLNIFNMKNIEAGPIARAWLPYHLPLGFHGNFVEHRSQSRAI
ncbi:MAG: carotenoid oxygenase family protein [Aliiglaciecola sp.]